MFKTFTDGVPLMAVDLQAIMNQGIITFASTTERDATLTGPALGQLCYVVGTGLQLYTTSWRTVATEAPSTPSTVPTTYSRFAAPGTTQQFPGSTWQRVMLSSTLLNSGAWTSGTLSGGTAFTCQSAGRYGITAYLRFASAVGGARGLSIADGTQYYLNVIAGSYYYQSATDLWADTVYGERTFAQGDTFSVWAYSATNLLQPSSDLILPFVNIRQIV
jgi:hypothetical protein